MLVFTSFHQKLNLETPEPRFVHKIEFRTRFDPTLKGVSYILCCCYASLALLYKVNYCLRLVDPVTQFYQQNFSIF